MDIYFFAAGNESAETNELEGRIHNAIPQMKNVNSIEDLIARLPKQTSSVVAEKAYVVFPFSREIHSSIDRIVDIASKYQSVLFFIFVSDDISATDYKRLVRTGGADWISSREAAQEIHEIIARHSRGASPPTSVTTKAAIVSFVPSAGGVGNSTIAMESAVQFATNKTTKGRAICLVDLDFQTSHICDLLDIEPRLNIEEFARNPERLDLQLFDQFLSHHSSGLDVLAAPKSKKDSSPLSIAALDALFGIISKRYNLVLVDFPVPWLDWTRQILSVSDTAIATGLLTIPGLRQVSETLRAIRSLEHVPPQIFVTLNRCHRRFLKGVDGMQYVNRMLRDERIYYVREGATEVQESVNTGIPIAVTNPGGKISKDITQLTSIFPGLKATQNSMA